MTRDELIQTIHLLEKAITSDILHPAEKLLAATMKRCLEDRRGKEAEVHAAVR